MVKHSGERPASPASQLDLREIRLKSGLSLESIADRTKISMRFLRAIEAEEFAKLPGGIFNISYLKQYAREVGMDDKPLLDLYRMRMGLTDGTALPVPAKPARTSPWRWLRFVSPERC